MLFRKVLSILAILSLFACGGGGESGNFTETGSLKVSINTNKARILPNLHAETLATNYKPVQLIPTSSVSNIYVNIKNPDGTTYIGLTLYSIQ